MPVFLVGTVVGGVESAPVLSWEGVRDAVATVALLGGLFFMFVGALGVFRFPDAYARMHAASKCTTLGLSGLLIAGMLHLWMLDIAGKSLLVLLFTFVATPIGTHLLAKAAHHAGAKQYSGTLGDQLAEDKRDPSMGVTDERIDGMPLGSGAWPGS